MKSYYQIALRTKSGRTYKFEFPVNTHEIMKDQDIIQHILSLPYMCVKQSDSQNIKTVVPRDAIDEITIKEI